MSAIAYLNWGRWVADCSNCGSAMELQIGQSTFRCWVPSGIGVCNFTTDLVWPEDPAAIHAGVAGNDPKDQDWTPEE
jgi:ssDNA-binding Zn-finger/Zn-ribbon topoisomerase 1